MNTFPKTDKQARTGSNVRGKAWAVHRAGVVARLGRPFEHQAREYRAAFKKHFSKADLRVAIEIVRRARKEFHLSNLKLGADSTKWAANKARHRRQLDRALTRALPAYRKWQTLAKARQREHRKLTGRQFAALTDRRVHLAWDNVLAPDAGETYEFVAPFAVYDAPHDDEDEANVRDQSFVAPNIGHLVNDVVFKQTDDPLIFTDIYGINWPVRYYSAATCGINFTTPVAGRLRITATLQNFYNKITCSVRDCFGFSEASIAVYLRLLIVVVQPHKVTELSTTLLMDGLTSYGSSLNLQFPELDTTAPYTMEATTDESFPANTGVQILAGAQLYIQSEIDDMETYANALLWWQLKNLTVNLV